VDALRAVKDVGELELLRQACAIADAAMERAVDLLREGITERELALDIEALMRASGADGIAFNLIQFGVRSALPHGEPLATPLEAGQFVLIDIGPRIDLYNADLTRTVVFGRAGEEQRRVYDAVLRAQLASLEAVRPGATGEEVDAVSRRIIESAGYGEYYGHSLGHAIAGGPMLAPGHAERLQPGNVVTVEPGIYIPELGGVRIEDTVLVTDHGYERLTHYPKVLREIPARA
jgi:Xaa-Pro aminopeptidase